MKLAENNTITSGDLEFGRKFKMQIDPASMQVIIDALTKGLYHDPYTAVLREVTSNAVDSHLAAGQTRPVEVTLPSRLTPSLIIQDWGVGLSAEELEEFGQYGASTKREDNGQIGGFGLGSKSPLAIASQFTVVAVKDGKRNVAVIGYGEDGPEGGLMDEEDTAEPNGVKITIPTSEVYKFQRAIEDDMFFGFKKGTIRFNGVEPESIHDNPDYTPILDEDGVTVLGWHSSEKVGRYSGTYALIGPVRYFVEWEKVNPQVSQRVLSGFLSEVVLNLPNGEIEIPRSRESITYNKRTRATLAGVVEKVVAQAKKVYEAQVEAAESPREALKLMYNAIDNGFTGAYTYKGQAITITPITDQAHTKLPLTLADPAYRGDKLYNERRKLKMEELNREHNQRSIAMHKSMLVHSAGSLSYAGNNYGYHEVSALASMYARARQDAGDKFIGTDIYITELPLAKLDKWLVHSFGEVLDGPTFNTVGLDYRRELARQTRAAAPKAAKPVDTLVRVFRYMDGGRGYHHEFKIDTLDATAKYIVLQSGQNDLTDKVIRTLTTMTGASENKALDALLARFLKQGTHTILLANKSWDVSGYGTVLPNIDTLSDAVGLFVKSLKVTSTPMEDRATKDLQAGVGRWATSFPPNRLAEIDRALTREWIAGMRSTSEVVENRKYVAEAERLGLYIAPKAQVGGAAVVLPDSPNSRYPLIAQSWSLSYPGPTIEYLNLMDAHLAKQGNP